jgi:hypothetical protein
VAAVWQVWQRGRCDDGIDRISAVILVPNSGVAVAVGGGRWGNCDDGIDRISAVILVPNRDVWQQCGSGSGRWQLEVGGVAQVDR